MLTNKYKNLIKKINKETKKKIRQCDVTCEPPASHVWSLAPGRALFPELQLGNTHAREDGPGSRVRDIDLKPPPPPLLFLFIVAKPRPATRGKRAFQPWRWGAVGVAVRCAVVA